MPTIHAHGVTLHYLQSGSGPDLVMVHGLTGNLATWHLRMVPLLQPHFRVTTYDLRGHGRSSMPSSGYTTRHMADDLLALMDALRIGSADLIGHSFGADTLLHFAHAYPERARRLVLIEPGIPALVYDRTHGEWEGWSDWSRDLECLTGVPVPAARRYDLDYLLRRTVAIASGYGPLRARPQRDDVLRLLETTTVTADHAVVGDLTLDHLTTVPHLKLLACAEDSPSRASFRRLAGRLINCTPVLLPAAGRQHFAPVEAPVLLVRHLTRFLGVDDNRQAAAEEPVAVSFT